MGSVFALKTALKTLDTISRLPIELSVVLCVLEFRYVVIFSSLPFIVHPTDVHFIYYNFFIRLRVHLVTYV